MPKLGTNVLVGTNSNNVYIKDILISIEGNDINASACKDSLNDLRYISKIKNEIQN